MKEKPDDPAKKLSENPVKKNTRWVVEHQYRLIYIAKFPEAVYVLHVITKKKTQQTPKSDIDKAKSRYGKLLEFRKEQKL